MTAVGVVIACACVGGREATIGDAYGLVNVCNGGTLLDMRRVYA